MQNPDVVPGKIQWLIKAANGTQPMSTDMTKSGMHLIVDDNNTRMGSMDGMAATTDGALDTLGVAPKHQPAVKWANQFKKYYRLDPAVAETGVRPGAYVGPSNTDTSKTTAPLDTDLSPWEVPSPASTTATPTVGS